VIAKGAAAGVLAATTSASRENAMRVLT
jgi:hypothetical protein